MRNIETNLYKLGGTDDEREVTCQMRLAIVIQIRKDFHLKHLIRETLNFLRNAVT